MNNLDGCELHDTAKKIMIVTKKINKFKCWWSYIRTGLWLYCLFFFNEI